MSTNELKCQSCLAWLNLFFDGLLYFNLRDASKETDGVLLDVCHLQGHHGHGHAESIVKLSNDERFVVAVVDL